MSIKIKIIKTIGLNPLCPRWLKVFCLQVTMNEIEKSMVSFFKGVDLSNISPEQRDALQKCVEKMNLARGKGIKA